LHGHSGVELTKPQLNEPTSKQKNGNCNARFESNPARITHQFRTRKDLNKAQRTRSKSNESAGKSTKLIDILPLKTVWLQVGSWQTPTNSIAC
jgi:hypothetical protein